MKRLIISIAALLLFVQLNAESMHSLKRRVGKLAVSQIELMDSELGQAQFPRSLHDDGSLQTSDIKYWCVGFFPGTAWYAYELTGKKSMRRIAQKNTLKIDIEQLTDNHDIGFEVWCSYGNAWRLTEDESYLPAIRRGAERLSARFCPTVGCTRSWNRDKGFWVIIDNMMNLELLEMSSRLFGIEDYDKIARTHANTTARNHFRQDLSTFHAVIYDEATGKIEKKQTVQGYADDSMWARGQAWGLYGYTMMYRFTRDTSYLAQARGIAKLLIPMLPEDGIPYWDYNDPAKENGEFCPRDASAAAIMASAMLELAGYVENSEEARMLRHTAEKQLLSLASPEYLCKKGECHGFLLKHSTGHRMRGIEVDKPLTYADYYFLEALTRL